MPHIKLTYQIVKHNGQFVARFEDEAWFGFFLLVWVSFYVCSLRPNFFSPR